MADYMKTVEAELVSACILRVRAGTTGPCGGDGGHGGRAFIELLMDGGGMRVSVDDDRLVECDRVTIEVGGDCELVEFSRALAIAAACLRVEQ